MRKISVGIIAILLALLLGVYYIFIRPIDDKIYFNYPTQYYSYEGGEVEFYMVNSNPKHTYTNHFFRVKLEVAPSFINSCNLSDFDWDLRRSSDHVLLFSTKSQSGMLNQSTYFENKIDSSVFKGIDGSGMGDGEFKVTVKVNPTNMCGFATNELIITKTMRLKHKRLTLWDAWMSI